MSISHLEKEKEVKTMEEKAQNQPPLEEKSVDKSEGRTMEEKAQNQQPLEESFARKSDSKPLNQEATPIGDSVSNLTHSEAKTSSDSSEAQNSSPPSASVQENASEEAPHSGLSLEEKVEHARKLLEEKQKAKAVEEFQKAHEEELKRRELGRNLTEFKVRSHILSYILLSRMWFYNLVFGAHIDRDLSSFSFKLKALRVL